MPKKVEYISKSELLDNVFYIDHEELVSADFIRSRPAADVAPVTHAAYFDIGSVSCRCNACGLKSDREYPYCHWCGSKMDGDTKGLQWHGLRKTGGQQK